LTIKEKSLYNGIVYESALIKAHPEKIPIWSHSLSELTLEDIAKLVGVHRSTVSRVVNGSPNVSPEVRQKVLKAIQATGFHPNAAARSLASQRSWMIGLVLPQSVSGFFTDPFFPHLTQGIAYACNNHDYTLSLFLVGNQKDEEKITPRISRRGMLDGILIQTGNLGDRLNEGISKSRIPSVVIGRPFIPDGISYIDVDNFHGGYVATQHLLSLGYHRIATISGPTTNSAAFDRLEGYKAAIQNNDKQLCDSLIIEGDFTEASGFTAMEKLLAEKPDAVFVASDLMAEGAMRAVEKAGLMIPDDIAFIGYDDVPLASLAKNQLTTIRQPIRQFGIKAVELLIDLIENGTSPVRRVLLENELIIRESCGAKRLVKSQERKIFNGD
jgi:LacI family transcriptional regulator